MAKFFKVIGTIILVLLILIIICIASVFIFHRVKISGEEKFLAEHGYCDLVSVGKYDLNVCSFGNDSPEHTFICMSGDGDGYFSLEMKAVTDGLSDKNKVVFVERAGYGMSDDTAEEQTVTNIVENYRTALNNAGIAKPYILMPHSLGGIYATYWENKYPDEIEGVVFIDSAALVTGGAQNLASSTEYSPIYPFLFGTLGFQRLLFPFYPQTDPSNEEICSLENAIYWKNLNSLAHNSELKNYEKNYRFACENIISNDIPKLYISASITTRKDLDDKEKFMEEWYRKAGMEYQRLSEEEAQKFIESEKDDLENKVTPYVKALGNCEIARIPGGHYIFSQKPDEVLKAIKNFTYNKIK